MAGWSIHAKPVRSNGAGPMQSTGACPCEALDLAPCKASGLALDWRHRGLPMRRVHEDELQSKSVPRTTWMPPWSRAYQRTAPAKSRQASGRTTSPTSPFNLKRQASSVGINEGDDKERLFVRRSLHGAKCAHHRSRVQRRPLPLHHELALVHRASRRSQP